MKRFLRKIDTFRTLPQELSETTAFSNYYSIVAAVLFIWIIFTETWDFMSTKTSTMIVMNKHENKFMDLVFDVSMLALDCNHVHTVIFDTFQDEPLEVESALYTRTPIKNGVLQEHLQETIDEMKRATKPDNNRKIPRRWDESSLIFRKKSFHKIIQDADFTLINFYANWCSHCKNFHTDWENIAEKIEGKQFQNFRGSTIVVKAYRVNCVEFAEICTQHNVQYYPNIQLYKKDYTFDVYAGNRDTSDIMNYLTRQTSAENHNFRTVEDAGATTNGCRLKGHIRAKRVPGEFHFEVLSGDSSLVPSMTNVSHTVHSLIIVNDTKTFDQMKINLPSEVLSSMDPLAGMTFAPRYAHKSPQHFLQVVSTLMDSTDHLAYQMTAQSHIKPEVRTAVPQAKFGYSISPMTVVLRNTSKPFYSFLTALLSILGGMYTMVQLVHFSTDTLIKTIKTRQGKLN